MDFMLFFQAILALLVVVGLALMFFGLIKYCEVKGKNHPFLRKMHCNNRISIVESKRLDARNTLVLARCDKEEYLFLLGNSQNLLLNTKKVGKDV